MFKAISTIDGYNIQTAKYRATIHTNTDTADRWSNMTDATLWKTLNNTNTLIYTGSDIWQCQTTNQQLNKIQGENLLTQTKTTHTIQELKSEVRHWKTQRDRVQREIHESILDTTDTAPPKAIQDFWDGERRRERYPPK